MKSLRHCTMKNETKSNTESVSKQTEKDSSEPQRSSEVFVNLPYQLEQTLQHQPYQTTAVHNLYSPNLRPNDMYDYESGLSMTQYNTFPIPPEAPKQVDYKTAFFRNQYQTYGNHFTEFYQLRHPHFLTGTPSLPSGATLSPRAVTPLNPVQNNLLDWRTVPTSVPLPTYPQSMSVGQHQSTTSSLPIHCETSIQLSQSPQNVGITSTVSSNIWNSGVGGIGNNYISSQYLNWMYPPFGADQQRHFQLFHSLYPMQPHISWPQRPTYHELLSILAPAVPSTLLTTKLKTVSTKAKARVSQLTSRTNRHVESVKHRRKLHCSGKSDPESILIKSPSSNSNFSNSVERPTELPERNYHASNELSKKKSPSDTFTDLSIG